MFNFSRRSVNLFIEGWFSHTERMEGSLKFRICGEVEVNVLFGSGRPKDTSGSDTKRLVRKRS